MLVSILRNQPIFIQEPEFQGSKSETKGNQNQAVSVNKMAMINNVHDNVDRRSMGGDTTEAWDSRYFSKKRNFGFKIRGSQLKFSPLVLSSLDVCVTPIYNFFPLEKIIIQCFSVTCCKVSKRTFIL